MPRIDTTRGGVVEAADSSHENIVLTQQAELEAPDPALLSQNDFMDENYSPSSWNGGLGGGGVSTPPGSQPQSGADGVDQNSPECETDVELCHHPADETGLRALGYHHWVIKTGPGEAFGVNGGEKNGKFNQSLTWLPENATLARPDLVCEPICGADADAVRDRTKPFSEISGSFGFDNNCYTNAADVLRQSGATGDIPEGPRPAVPEAPRPDMNDTGQVIAESQSWVPL
jgi:hypothetical protein